MKIKLIVVGKTNATYLVEGEKEYENRLRHYTKFEEIIIPDLKQSGKLSEKELKKKEGQLILGIKLENKTAISNAPRTLAVPGICFGDYGLGDISFSLGFNVLQ